MGRVRKIVEVEKGVFNFYDYSEFGHLFRASLDDLHILAYDLIELLQKHPAHVPLEKIEGPDDHEGAD